MTSKIVAIAIWFFIAFLCHWIYKACKSEHEMKKAVLKLLSCAVTPAVAQSLYLLSGHGIAGYIFIALYEISMDILLVALVDFSEAYTKQFRSVKAIKICVYLFILADAVNYFLNVHFNHIFKFGQISFLGKEMPVLEYTSKYVIIHEGFCYIFAFSAIMTLLITMVKAPLAYKSKYRSILWMIIVVVIANAYISYIGTPFDWTVCLYCLVGMQICYYTLFFTPQNLIDRTLSMVVSGMSEAVICFDIDNKVVYSNDTLKAYFEDEETRDAIEKFFVNTDGGENDGREEGTSLFQMMADGEQKTYDVTFKKLFDETNKYMGCFYSFLDRTDEIKQYEQEYFNLSHDALTGIYNRTYFFEAVAEKLARNPEDKYYMVTSNIRGFKFYNDMFGEKMGDEVLKFESALLQKFAHEETIFGRISGDEFAALVPEKLFSEELFRRSIEIMREKFNTPHYKLHVYIGVYKIEDNSEPVSVMCDKCRMTIESFKGDYSTIVTYYEDELLKKHIREKNMIGEFDHALENGEFHMFLQPQVNREGKVMGAEALVRWIHPEKGLVPPYFFIPVFEETGLIYRLDACIWEQAAKKLKEWEEAGRADLYISVNISMKDFFYMDVAKKVTELVNKYNISPARLRLELTETALASGDLQTTDVLFDLRRRGFIVEIDDFGSGYSSLNMLKNIDVDVVKVDMGFLDKKDEMGRAIPILDSVVKLITRLGMDVITEGVETEDQVQSLLSMGCEKFQGYHFAKPMPVEEFEDKYLEK